MRGEDDGKGFYVADQEGSPPHARGRQRVAVLDGTADGITPACAGKTGSILSVLWTMADHPRMRGEDVSKPFPTPCAAGSPPHARGRRQKSGRDIRRCRITPACAGKTTGPVSKEHHMSDHPRMRGEDFDAST